MRQLFLLITNNFFFQNNTTSSTCSNDLNNLTNCTTATKQLQTLLTETQAELTNTKRSLVDYARKNEDLLVRITEQRLAQEKLEKVESLYFLHVSSFNACAPFRFRF